MGEEKRKALQQRAGYEVHSSVVDVFIIIICLRGKLGPSWRVDGAHPSGRPVAGVPRGVSVSSYMRLCERQRRETVVPRGKRRLRDRGCPGTGGLAAEQR